ncbi:transcriptional regulator, IclR family [Faunimonas pinastri]|uniref:Transcriptional regulator, IclR family n=1 Tax=Faunimonas pinastri TaxID=1855383 RepID=A0A1H9PFC9_9HYPH|nr:IclR family transcriptional regulator [Faunimonas pinastri]SER46847.1 transcriptional regulator, IclR family [Faunimonas pinastri]
MTDVDAGERYRAPALDKGLDILELLAETEEGLSQAEIAKALERTPNEIYRMLDRLVRRSYVVRTQADRYELTLKIFVLAHRHAPMRRLVSHALPVLRRFAREAEQAAHLVVFDRGALVVVAQVDPPGYWSLAIRTGSHIGLNNTGSGHVFLAFATPDERRLMQEEHDPMPNEMPPDDLGDILERVRRDGYEIHDSQQISAVQNLSVPIFGPLGGVIAVLTCPFLHRLDTSEALDADAVLNILLAAATEISAASGGTKT